MRTLPRIAAIPSKDFLMFQSSRNNPLLDEAAVVIRNGDTIRGEQMLLQVLRIDPSNVLAVLWLTKCTDDPYRRASLFRQALAIDPTNPHALKGLDLYRKYVRRNRNSSPPPIVPQLADSAADFEPSSLSIQALPSNRPKTRIVALALLLVVILASFATLILLRPSTADVLSSVLPMALLSPEAAYSAFSKACVTGDIAKAEKYVTSDTLATMTSGDVCSRLSVQGWEDMFTSNNVTGLDNFADKPPAVRVTGDTAYLTWTSNSGATRIVITMYRQVGTWKIKSSLWDLS